MTFSGICQRGFPLATLALLGICPVDAAADPASVAVTSIGIDEKLGHAVPLDLTLVAEDGAPVRLAELIDRPTVLVLVYYRCPGICNPLLHGVLEVVGRVDLEPGVDFRVLTVSIDETEGFEDARRKKENLLPSLGRPLPVGGWRFLTGNKAEIDRLADAVGFRFVREGKEFRHPGCMTLLSPEGKVTRYLYGLTFLPFDLEMGIVEAAEGRVGPTINRVLRLCFTYDPEGRTYVFSLLRVVGTMTMLFVGAFAVFLVVTTKKHRREVDSYGS